MKPTTKEKHHGYCHRLLVPAFAHHSAGAASKRADQEGRVAVGQVRLEQSPNDCFQLELGSEAKSPIHGLRLFATKSLLIMKPN
jgi:hypothetical protein